MYITRKAKNMLCPSLLSISKFIPTRLTLGENLFFKMVEVSHGMNLYRLRQHRVQAMTQLQQR